MLPAHTQRRRQPVATQWSLPDLSGAGIKSADQAQDADGAREAGSTDSALLD